MFMLTWLNSKIAAIGASIVAGLAIFAAVRQSGKKDERNEQAARDAKDQRKVDDAYRGAGGSPADIRDRLRDPKRDW